MRHLLCKFGRLLRDKWNQATGRRRGRELRRRLVKKKNPFGKMRNLLISCVLFILGAGRAPCAGVGTLLKDFDYEVIKFAQDPVRERIYATTTNNSVIVIDTNTATVAQEIFIGSQPHGLDVKADGSRLYVACSGSTTAGIGVIDLTTLTKLPSLLTPFRPAHIAAGLADRLYVTFVDDASIKQLNAADGVVQASIGFPQVTDMAAVLAITPDRKKLIYGDVGLSPARLKRFDVSGATLTFSQESIFGRVGENGERLMMSHSGNTFCYATGGGQGNYGIALIPTTDLNASIGIFQCDAYPANGSFNADDTVFYTAPASQNKVRIFNTATFLETGSFQIANDESVGEIICDRGGRRLYVAGASFFGPAKMHVYALTDTKVLITSADTTTAHKGGAFAFSLTCDTPGVTFAATGLPAGLNINPASGLISGTPTQPGVFVVPVSATAVNREKAIGQLTIDVQTPFTVVINGHGSVVPGGAGTTWWTVGSMRELLATPDDGFGFVGWADAITSVNPHLFFLVQADSTLQATFSQLVPFTVAVNGPGRVTPQYLGTTQQPLGTTVAITATADPGARFTGWTGAVTASQNPLTISLSSNATVTANFETVTFAPLTVLTSGPGRVSAEFLGTTVRDIGAFLAIAATPIPGTRFIGWSGAVTSTDNPLVLNFTGPATLVANFESLTIYGGNYTAIAPPDPQRAQLIAFWAAVDSSGAFTGRLVHGSARYPVLGSVSNLDGTTINIPRRSPQPPLLLRVRLALVDGAPTVLATLIDGSSQVELRGFRAAAFAANHSAPYAGRYTFILPPPEGESGPPAFGHGNGVAVVGRNGAATFSGSLGDGRPFAAGCTITENGHVFLAVPLFGGGGYLTGQLDFRDAPGQSDFDGELNWSRPALPTLRYASGFSVGVTILGSRYVAPRAGTNIFAAQTGNVTMSGGDLPFAITTPISFGPGNVVIPGLPANGLQCRLQSGTGLFSGTFLPPGRIASRTFLGVIYQKLPAAVAVQRSATGVGSVVLVPATP